jgi:hypothetical protein
VDLKDKYREVVELLRAAQEDARRSRKRTYPGLGRQTGMFSLPVDRGEEQLVLPARVHRCKMQFLRKSWCHQATAQHAQKGRSGR